MENRRFNIHDELREMDQERIRLVYSQKALDFAVCVVNLSGGLNMGAIVRSANFYGAKEIFYVGRRHYNRVSAVGTYKYMTVNYLSNFDDLDKLKDRYVLVGIENNVPECQSIFDVQYAKKTLFVFGEEGCGLPPEILEKCDQIVEIPENGTVRSMNVSVAAGTVMFDYVCKNRKLT